MLHRKRTRLWSIHCFSEREEEYSKAFLTCIERQKGYGRGQARTGQGSSKAFTTSQTRLRDSMSKGENETNWEVREMHVEREAQKTRKNAEKNAKWMPKRGRETITEKGTKGHETEAKRARNESRKGHERTRNRCEKGAKWKLKRALKDTEHMRKGRETKAEKGTKGHGTKGEKEWNESRKGRDAPETSSGGLHFFWENPDPAGSRIFRIPDPEFSDPDLRIPNSRIPGSRILGSRDPGREIFSLAGSRILTKFD